MAVFSVLKQLKHLIPGLLLAPDLLANAAPANLVKRNSTCSNISYRKSWNVLNDTEKSDYITAQKCLMELPPKVGTIWNAQNRWDEFDWVHINLANTVHDSGQFLPWHRWYIRVMELALQEECNYTGALPYWDELKDQATAPLANSSVFDPTTGFGGDGDPNNNYCIIDGPFVNATYVMNQTSNYAHECLSRQFNQTRFDEGPSDWSGCQEITNYTSYWECNSNTEHGLGHIAIGGIYGMMANAVTASGDPLFFLHHAWLDRVWWKWQMQDEDNRLTDMGGLNIERDALVYSLGLSQPNKYTLDYNGDDGGNQTTLNHVLYTHDLRANVTVGDVMDIRGDTICVEYVDDGVFNYTLGY